MRILFSVFAFLILTAFYSPMAGNPDFLWEVISLDCVPNQKANANPDPCAEVTFEKENDVGYAVF